MVMDSIGESKVLRVSLKTCTQDEENEDDEPPSHSRKQPTEAWEARPYSSQSTASTFASTGKHQDAASGYSVRPTSSTSQMSGFTPSTTPGSKRSTASRRSRLSRSGSLPSSAGSPEALREAALCASGIPRPSSREIALNDVKLEDARQRATKSLEVLQAKLRASRADSVPSEETKSTKTKSVRLQDPAFAAPGPARGGQAWARYKGTPAASSQELLFSASGRSAGEALTEAQRTSRLERAPQVEQGWRTRGGMLKPQPSVLGQRYADAADGV
ncbi:unnamed protein product [Durusdinium trenchii]|uniref:Uncharacterized protein n=1 Tax=Durusdinium trenchii TaxID=1381693 RepID=A0ABP0I2R7_9DINO